MGENTKKFVVGLSLIIAAVLLVPTAGSAGGEPNASQQKSDCVIWTTEARMVGFAYNHLVHLINGCKHAMTCEITTNVNPKAIHAELEKDEKETVLTFRGSPARTFTAKVNCEKK